MFRILRRNAADRAHEAQKRAAAVSLHQTYRAREAHAADHRRTSANAAARLAAEAARAAALPGDPAAETEHIEVRPVASGRDGARTLTTFTDPCARYEVTRVSTFAPRRRQRRALGRARR